MYSTRQKKKLVETKEEAEHIEIYSMILAFGIILHSIYPSIVIYISYCDWFACFSAMVYFWSKIIITFYNYIGDFLINVWFGAHFVVADNNVLANAHNQWYIFFILIHSVRSLVICGEFSRCATITVLQTITRSMKSCRKII